MFLRKVNSVKYQLGKKMVYHLVFYEANIVDILK